jgi:hypothetical protein
MPASAVSDLEQDCFSQPQRFDIAARSRSGHENANSMVLDRDDDRGRDNEGDDRPFVVVQVLVAVEQLVAVSDERCDAGRAEAAE